LEEPISRKLLQLAKIYLGVFSKRVEHLDLNRYHFMLLLIAEHEGQLTQKRIAEISGKDKSSMVNIIDTLTEKGYVYREINPGDRREQLIKITEKAKLELPAIQESYSVLNQTASTDIDPKKLVIFYEVLQQMSANLIPLSSTQVSFRLKKSKPLKRKS